ncbi:Transcription factor [Coemansia sp. RSA 990]|nr:Transcription factor [Coemansia sp. RSA 1086]KAJ1750277.1 Transcription factor [Coemansia sp. RSA 1821]KAJ1871280.1 Transcription factor [Coemansia sp. RSA 990]KAJ2676141.1 Transcription factor [Coemansia sp. RSA 1085]
MKSDAQDTGPQRKPSAGRAKRQKVTKACVYCQRSHMSCNNERPCQRCIKRNIGHMCHDKEPAEGAGEIRKRKSSEDESNALQRTATVGSNDSSNALPGVAVVGSNDSGSEQGAEGATSSNTAMDAGVLPMLASVHTSLLQPREGSGTYLQMGVSPMYTSETGGAQSLPLPVLTAGDAGRQRFNRSALLPFGNDIASNEFSALNEFLESLQRGLRSTETDIQAGASQPDAAEAHAGSPQPQCPGQQDREKRESLPTITQLMQGRPGMTQTERFLLTAADPNDGTSEDKLRQIINAKYEAGILKPYNYVSGYARMQRFMETHLERGSIMRILEVLNTFRPTFRTIAQSLTDIDLLLVEEGFERLLLDYDSVFNAFGVPACLWRRTGEIYKANREFADLVGVPLSFFHEGRVCIYELMSEASAVNYWEKYGEIAFDASQKAVLTTCVLQTAASVRSLVQSAAKNLGDARPMSSSSIALKISGVASQPSPSQPGRPVRCCFSFTLRRDKYNIPLGIIGNFIPVPS